MYRTLFTAALFVCAFRPAAASLADECRAPARPAIPDGSTTTEEALLEARTELEKYLADGDVYLVCLRGIEERLGDAIADVDGHEILTRYNAMVDEMYLAGDEFNIALRRFRSQ